MNAGVLLDQPPVGCAIEGKPKNGAVRGNAVNPANVMDVAIYVNFHGPALELVPIVDGLPRSTLFWLHAFITCLHGFLI